MAEILVVGLSARALSAAARSAGYRPLAADFFRDLDLEESAEASVQIEGDFAQGFARAPLLDALLKLAAGRAPIGVVCGTGFEDRPALLDALAARWRLFGNDAAAVAQAKDPAWLAALCARLAIPHPRWSDVPQAGWLRKRTGGSGGSHVADGGEDAAELAVSYWQERVAGEPVSALILGSGAEEARVLGFSAQWADPAPGAPFRYGGAVRPAELPPPTEAALARAAEAAISECRLVGLNGVDFLVAPAGWHLVEINPRPGATLDVFQPDDASIFELHLRACDGVLPQKPPRFASAAAACTVYARRRLSPVPDFAWPDWTADRQRPGTSVESGAPLCTVLARAEHAVDARRLAERRAALIHDALGAS